MDPEVDPLAWKLPWGNLMSLAYDRYIEFYLREEEKWQAGWFESQLQADSNPYQGHRRGEKPCESSHELLLDGKACPSCRAQV